MKCKWLIVFGFLGAILLGAVLFMLPISSPAHTWMRPGDALFTACSAVCITGLTVVDVGRDLSCFGQAVLLCLVQLGCAGIMTCATFFLVVVGRRISLASEFSLMNAYGVSGVRGFRSLVVWVVSAMLVIEVDGSQHYTTRGMEKDAARDAWLRGEGYRILRYSNADVMQNLDGVAEDILTHLSTEPDKDRLKNE